MDYLVFIKTQPEPDTKLYSNTFHNFPNTSGDYRSLFYKKMIYRSAMGHIARFLYTPGYKLPSGEAVKRDVFPQVVTFCNMASRG